MTHEVKPLNGQKNFPTISIRVSREASCCQTAPTAENHNPFLFISRFSQQCQETPKRRNPFKLVRSLILILVNFEISLTLWLVSLSPASSTAEQLPKPDRASPLNASKRSSTIRTSSQSLRRSWTSKRPLSWLMFLDSCIDLLPSTQKSKGSSSTSMT